MWGRQLLLPVLLYQVVFLQDVFSYSDDDTTDNKIVGGRYIRIEQVPFQAFVLTDKNTCGGVIYSKKCVMTAAHCVVNTTKVQVRVGFTQWDDSEEKYPYRNGTAIVHEKYNNTDKKHQNFDYDIAIIKLFKELEVDDVRIAIAKLVGSGEQLADGTNCTVSGWGSLRDNSIASAYLKAAYVKKVNYNECKKVFKKQLTPRMVCAGSFYSGGYRFTNVCRGDSGGPLFDTRTKKVAGLTSHLFDCDINLPAAFTNLADPGISEWIKNHTQCEN
ncbi:unnamed protein product [Leptidea sinapis]|uniref:Peptidase S1 domain-containing protein n=1 Tax=Leptidea sinapis TaxID=189913 RepID=A0A5E4QBH1_9NEOP|nr:unnamed protein product [Leptidea sinapis]